MMESRIVNDPTKSLDSDGDGIADSDESFIMAKRLNGLEFDFVCSNRASQNYPVVIDSSSLT